jgi:hypothetical protein
VQRSACPFSASCSGRLIEAFRRIPINVVVVVDVVVDENMRRT